MKKIEMSSTGVYVIHGLFLELLGQKFKLNDWVFSSFNHVDPKRLVAVVRQQDFQYGETSVGYIWKFEPDNEHVVSGKIWLGDSDKGEGHYTPIHTSEIIGWCYLDEPIK